MRLLTRVLLYIVQFYPAGLCLSLAWLSQMLAYIAVIPVALLAQGEPITSLTEKYDIFGTIIAGQFVIIVALWKSLTKERDQRILDLEAQRKELTEGFKLITSALDNHRLTVREALDVINARARDGR